MQSNRRLAQKRATWLCRAAVCVALSAVTVSAFAAQDFGKCEVSGQKGSVKLTTVVPGALSVRPVLGVPGWWNGDSPDTIKDGFEYCMAANMAYRAGLDRVVLVSRSFQQILTGKSEGFDIALSEITITEPRKQVVNFTVPYFNSDQGILVKAGTKVDKKNLGGLRYAVERGTTAYDYIVEKVKPTEQPKVFNDPPSMYTALAAGQVDAVIYDTPNVLLRAKNSNGQLEVVGRFDTGETWGGLVNKDSPNLAAFNQLIESMKKDGTLEKLSTRYLTPELGADPTKVPVLNP
ncbi:ABC transporter substrate-binding protein [Paraburkholderia rhizosphaerae]|uniref:Amino acid ABC transporter substrate-binding protein (PAAT family) n=1 Tax=Paraburkholderia rhizosphaerae TaxID=480658 RepID=A0A4R8LZB3_9BURK|nr:ABC transporter substrate-binding protein [Paraburkholderia rhizosphaerae]TDY52201.1 amino acid ABC transporter substrate-binding protein (PAAT family) [Paraburkholderia rhizosphaerae]